MNNKIKIVFFDIDGTLVSFKTHKIPSSTIDAVSALRRQGIKVYIATGRPVAFIDNLGDLEYDGMITVTGAHCFTRDGKVIFNQPVSKDNVERIIKYMESGAETYPIIFVAQDGVFVTEINPDLEYIAGLLNIEIPAVTPVSEARNHNILQIISFFKADIEKKMMDEVMPGCVSMRWHPLFTDIIADGVSKSVGIDKVLEYEGIPLESAMAFGDGGNDLSMISHVPYGIAMGNACDELKSLATYVTTDVDDNGVANALKYYGLID